MKRNSKKDKKPMSCNEKSCKAIERYIVKLLKDNGTWNNTCTYAVEKLAANIVYWRKLKETILSPDFSFLILGSQGQQVKNPLHDAWVALDKTLEDSLKRLGMNIKDSLHKPMENDPINSFLKEFQDDDED